MKTLARSIGTFIVLLVVQAMFPVLAQENFFQMHLVTDLPAELNPDNRASCRLELEEEWTIDAAGISISKTVESFTMHCADGTISLSPDEEVIRFRTISYEFSFLELPDQMAKEVQLAFIALINKRFPIPDVYDPPDQLLSVYFHEEWTIDPGKQEFTKKVRAITPVIWQLRQTADGEPVPDPDSGLPVFYKHKLERIDLRKP